MYDLIRQLGGAAARKEERRLLGLDVGDKYVGLALSDLDNKIASLFSVLLRKKSNLNLTLMASDFDSLISLYSLKGFVIGIPWDRHRVSSDAVRIKSFVNDLSKTNMLQGLPYTFWNEQFTSKIWMEREWVKATPFLAPI
ncbi:hypothetical protein RIF29_15534 [Crotalaria pallida]|uniref:YqgF/RNase H-like domain-containing protein n=1 Tax=Crotalaria pallida TaxID=3830 RepID=A0AAN9FFR6_CROPI